jgi:PAS domain S-box-containing protein
MTRNKSQSVAARAPGSRPARLHLHYESAVYSYSVAVASIALTGAAYLTLIGTAPIRAPFFLFYVAFALSAFLGGLGPGIFAIGLAGSFALVFFNPTPGAVSWVALCTLGPVVCVTFAYARAFRDESRASSLELARFKFIGDHASDWIFLLSEEGQIQYANDTACNGLGWPERDLIATSLEELVTEAEKPGLRTLLSSARVGEARPMDVTFQRRDKSTTPSELSCTGIRTGRERVIHVAGRDIAERREIERKLREVRLWESLGVMAGGMAHDFNNLLMSVIGNAELARQLLPPEHEVAGLLNSVVSAGERSAELVRMMLATSGQRSRDTERLDLVHILNWVLSSHSIPGNVTIVKNVEPVPFTGERRTIETLLWSLISNAAESYGDAAGEVRIAIKPAVCPEGGVAHFEEGNTADGDYLCVIVEDDGSGMPADVLSRAFDPFFSTKFTGRGLGLPAVRGIVRAYGGQLRLMSIEGQCTRVEAWLPVVN